MFSFRYVKDEKGKVLRSRLFSVVIVFIDVAKSRHNCASRCALFAISLLNHLLELVLGSTLLRNSHSWVLFSV